jgi:peptidyl-prolyl cis-trans isomerase B (cyclophilin B)
MFARILFVIFGLSLFAGAQDDPKKANARPQPSPPPVAAAPAGKPEPFDKADINTMAGECVRLEAEVGNIEVELYPEQAPESVRNFLNLTALGLFDTTTFSRVVPGFVIQGGDLKTRESPPSVEIALRSRKTIPDEPNNILHEPGVLSMARTDEPHSASTHFFILVSAAPHLDGTFAAFGRVTKGMDVVEQINKAPVTGEKPDKPVRIKKALVFPCTTP